MTPEESLLEVLTNGQAFAALAKESGFFTKICPHVSTRWRDRNGDENESPETEEATGRG